MLITPVVRLCIAFTGHFQWTQTARIQDFIWQAISMRHFLVCWTLIQYKDAFIVHVSFCWSGWILIANMNIHFPMKQNQHADGWQPGNHESPPTLLAKTLGSISIWNRYDANVSDRCLIDVDTKVFAIWAGRAHRKEKHGKLTPRQHIVCLPRHKTGCLLV